MSKIAILLVFTVLVAGCTQNGPAAPEGNQPADQASQPATGGASLSSILAARAKYKADYTVTASGQTSQLTMVFDAPRVAMFATTADGEARTYFEGSSATACSRAEGAWQCLKASIQVPAAVQTEEDIKQGKLTPTYAGTCTRAGLSGSKYQYQSDRGTATVCYTSDGILLESETSNPASTMVASSVSKDVTAADFTPPAEPQELPSAPAMPSVPELS
ncbi:MAG: hypothetical protein HY519_02970 [Candidatus Aenigmarchaeota archaeon]|nr:hypothetical protein [Candidatus Aenigmarchaeota archaeon]